MATKGKTYKIGIGKRKVATARVYLSEGKGIVTINKKPLEEYFGRSTDRMLAMMAINLLELDGKFDFKINVSGSGPTGQAGAIRHGISRALLSYDENFKAKLKKAGFLTRDSRMVERKKYGQAGARRRFQYSKR